MLVMAMLMVVLSIVAQMVAIMLHMSALWYSWRC